VRDVVLGFLGDVLGEESGEPTTIGFMGVAADELALTALVMATGAGRGDGAVMGVVVEELAFTTALLLATGVCAG
jgi:hypothetical protein